MFAGLELPAGGDRAGQLVAVTEYAEGAGARVEYARLPGTRLGAYDYRTGTIFVRHGISTGHQLAVIAHELCHHTRGDIGPQPGAVEQYIDEKVADLLISPGEYALAERLYDGATPAIAMELDLPRHIVSAYRRPLWRRGTIGVQPRIA